MTPSTLRPPLLQWRPSARRKLPSWHFFPCGAIVLDMVATQVHALGRRTWTTPNSTQRITLNNLQSPPMTAPAVERWFAWAPLAAAGGHIFEEFVFPGGFMPWYSRYRGPKATSVNSRFLFIINVVLLAVCFNAGLAAQNSEALPYWLGIVSLLCADGVWHIWAAIRSRGYSPGMFTGAVLYIPLAIYGLVHLLRLGLISVPDAALAICVGGSYHIWSAVFHRRSNA
jgi:hypothetical protein